MPSEMPGGPFIDMVRDAGIKFPDPFMGGVLPPPETREQLTLRFRNVFEARGFTEEQIKEALDFFVTYEERYYEMLGGSGQCYHRACGGFVIVQGITGIFCAKCGKLPDLIPPITLR